MDINVIYNEDCVGEQGMSRIADGSVDMVVTDPPYNIVTGGDSGGKNSARPKGMLSGDRKLFSNIPKFSEWLPDVYRVLKEGSHCYIFVNSTNLTEMLVESAKVGFKLHNVLIWEKNNCTPSQFYMKNCEYIVFLRKGKAKYINNIGASKTVHRFNNIIGNKVHPTEKPEDLIRFYIENSSDINDIIFDPFMGSGTTAVACVNTKRSYIGFEMDKGYYDIAVERIEAVKVTSMPNNGTL